MTWDAFVSYSHAADGALAPAIQSGLQRFMRPWYRRRALRVFRDETGLSVDPGLWTSIVAALDQSRYFVLFASPEAAQSRWVNREVEHWLAHKSAGHILPVVTDGEWIWDEAAADFDWQRSTAAPLALKGAFDQEPRHLDLRWARQADRIDLRNPRFLDAIAELAAPMHGKAKDELVGEDIRLTRRARRLAWGAISGLCVLTVAAVGAAVVAEVRRIEAEARRLAVQSRQVAAQPDLAFLLATAGHRMAPSVETEAAVYAAAQGVPEFDRMLRHHGAPVWSVTLLPERDLIISGDNNGKVVAADRRSGSIVADYQDGAGRAVVNLLPDTRRGVLIVVTLGGMFELDLARFTLRSELLRGGPTIWDGARDPRGSHLALALDDGTVAIWNVETARQEATLRMSSDKVTAVAYSPDGRLLASGSASEAPGSANGALAVWSTDDGRPEWAVDAAHQGGVVALDFSPDGTRLASGGSDGWVHVWQTDNGAKLSGRLAHTGPAWTVGFSRDHPAGEFIGSVGSDGEIEWVDARSFNRYPPTRVHTGRANVIAFADGGTYASGGEDRMVAHFDPVHPWVVAGSLLQLNDTPSSLALIGGGRVAVAHGASGQVEIYHLPNFAPVGPSMRADAVVATSVALPGPASILLGLADGRILDWSPESGSVRASSGHEGAVLALALAPDGGHLYSLGEDRTVRRWRVTDNDIAEDQVLSSVGNRTLALSADGRLLAYGHADGGAEVIDTASARPVARFIDGAGPAATEMAFDPERPLLYIGDAYGQIGVWHLTTGKAVSEARRGHQGEISGIAVDIAHDELLTVGRDGALRRWRAGDAEPLGVAIPLDPSPAKGIIYDAATKLVITGVLDRRVIAQQLDVEKWIVEGCDHFARNLTAAEMRRFGVESCASPCPDRIGGP